MGQKTHPLGFRIGITQKHRSSWYAKMNSYSKFLHEDYQIRQSIENNVSNASISNIYIKRKIDQIEIDIYTARPGIILGKDGLGTNILREKLQNKLKNNTQIRVNLVEVKDPDIDATLVAEFIAQQLEKRTAFRRAVRQGIQRSNKTSIGGIKVQISGRLNGAEIARSEWVREGRVPLQTLRANIDYSYKIAQTIHGILGVKVWLFKDEVITKTQDHNK